MTMNLTLANKNPFSTFDFLGYFFPGALLLLLTYILSDGLDLLDTPKSVMRLKELTQCYPVIGGLTLVIISYVIGHLVSYMSSSTVELFYVWCHGYPSTFLLQQNPTLEPILKSSKGRLGMIWHIAVHPDYQRKGIGEKLLEADTNINLGTKYISTLLKKYQNVALALTAYNAGIGTVDTWIEKGSIREDGTDIENIPYKETNNYVRKILRDYRIYQDLYSNS